MHFQTVTGTEFGLRMIDEALLEAFRKRFKKPLRIKWNPSWAHRKVTRVRTGNQVSVTVSGLAYVRIGQCQVAAHVAATARLFKSRGCSFPVSVVGTYADDEYRDTEYYLQKERFPKDM